MLVGDNSSRLGNYIEMGNDNAPIPDIPLSVPVNTGATIVETVLIDVKTTIEESRVQSKGPHTDNAWS